MVPPVAQLYRDSMRRHRFGYALYEPVPFERLHSGMLGFLDEYQRWHPIFDLSDDTMVQAEGFPPLDHSQSAHQDTRCWGPLTTSNVSMTEVELEAGVDATALGLPFGVSGIVSYSTASGFGAILVCDKDIVSEGFDLRDPFLGWLKQNAKLLFSKYPDAKKHGICVATWTYSTTDIHISTWEGANNSVTVGCTIDAMGIGHAGPKTTWHRGHASSGWLNFTDQKRVTFFTGVKIKMGVFGTKEKPEPSWRGRPPIVKGKEQTDSDITEVELFGNEPY
ncbi:hypothetical protein GGR51DRAFT_557571 [Nemania sp. FL0031]|nr:hypothetical protein GGR51DRAFT_557571 [Nemania sp. FL0031]